MRLTTGTVALCACLFILGLAVGRYSSSNETNPPQGKKIPLEQPTPVACPPTHNEGASAGVNCPTAQCPESTPPPKDHVAVFLPIEPIGENNMFRHPDWRTIPLGIDDRSYIKFLPSMVKIESIKPGRKIYFDLGLNSFESSIKWMLQNYPVTFDEIYGWESVPHNFRLPNDWPQQFHGKSEFIMKLIGLKDTEGMTNLLRFMDDLKLSEQDYVVMKMDVEGAEWDLIPALFSQGYFRFIDEFMVEIHYYEPILAGAGWLSFPHKKEEVVYWMDTLRKNGVYAHYWP